MKRFFHCQENTYGSSLAIRFRESLRGFSLANLRDIVSSTTIDIAGWTIKSSRRVFKHKKGKDKRYLSVNDFLTEKEKPMKKKRKNNQKSLK